MINVRETILILVHLIKAVALNAFVMDFQMFLVHPVVYITIKYFQLKMMNGESVHLTEA